MDNEKSLRERLIDVGVDLVITEGSASLGLREIARRAGVSHGAPRRHFPTHQALLSAIARRGFEDLGARFEAAIEGAASAQAQLRALARVYVAYALEHRGMFELMFRHDLLDSEGSPSDRPRLRESTLPLYEFIVRLVARYRTERDTAREPVGPAGTEPPPAVTAAALWSNIHGIAQLWAWRSLQLALGAPPSDAASGGAELDRLVDAALDAHLGPVSV
ncbi:TetR/AcrR family transcriptional regulator [Streptomyces sp. NPDC014734]|uniref:TetR/AcrR family transcriptional regulator n=1 Tax=Streptomyces sp. NPDC014734 TaxID=3364886 RepID=UPI0036FE48D5